VDFVLILRSALASVQATIGIAEPAAEAPAAADADVDMSAAEKLPEPVESIIASTHASLSSTRKKRKPAPGYTTPAQIKSFTQQSTVPSLHATKPAGITALDVSADGKLAVTGGADKTVHVFDFESGKTLATLKGHTKPVKQVALVEKEGEARLAVSCSADKTVKVWSEGTDGAKWSLQHNLTGHKGEISGISVHPSQRFVAAGSTDETWSLYDLTSGETVKTYDPLAGQSGSFAYTSFAGHPDGILHGGGTQDGSIRIWDVRDASALAASLTSPTSSPTTTLSFSENGYYLASASATDPTVTIFDLRKLTVLSSWSLPAENKITEVRFDPSAQFLSVVGTDARVYANKSWDELCVFDDNAGDLTGARFVDLGRKLVLSGMDRTLRVLGASE
jgi:pre-mRNA-processing factor 19